MSSAVAHLKVSAQQPAAAKCLNTLLCMDLAQLQNDRVFGFIFLLIPSMIFFALLFISPSRIPLPRCHSDPGSFGRLFSPITSAVRAFLFTRRILRSSLFPRRPVSNCTYYPLCSKYYLYVLDALRSGLIWFLQQTYRYQLPGTYHTIRNMV